MVSHVFTNEFISLCVILKTYGRERKLLAISFLRLEKKFPCYFFRDSRKGRKNPFITPTARAYKACVPPPSPSIYNNTLQQWHASKRACREGHMAPSHSKL